MTGGARALQATNGMWYSLPVFDTSGPTPVARGGAKWAAVGPLFLFEGTHGGEGGRGCGKTRSGDARRAQ